MLKQKADTILSTNINILESHVFKYGRTIEVNHISKNIFTLIKETVPTLSGLSGSTGSTGSSGISRSSGSSGISSSSGIFNIFYIDSEDNYKLKYNNIVVPNGLYLMKTSLNTSEWKNVIQLYNIIDGLPEKYSETGVFVDLNNDISIEVTSNDDIIIPSNGCYYLPNIFYAVNIIDGNVYYFPNNYFYIKINNNAYQDVIVSFENKKGVVYTDRFINLESSNYYINNKICGTCDSGSIIVCDDIILIKSKTGWKYSNLFDISI